MNQFGELFFDNVNNVPTGRTLQAIVNDLDANRNNVLDTKGFIFARPQNSVEFTQYTKDLQIIPQSIGVDYQSHPLPFPELGYELQRGSLLRHKTRRDFGEDDYRKLVDASEGWDRETGGRIAAATELIGSIGKHMISHYNRISGMCDAVISKGGFTWDLQTNPLGLKKGFFPSGIPQKNVSIKSTVATHWFNANGTPNTSADPIEDMKEVVEYMENERNLTNIVGESNYYSLKKIVMHPNVLSRIAATRFPNATGAAWATQAISDMGVDALISAMGTLVGCTFSTDRKKVLANVVFNETTGRHEQQTYRSFAEDVVVFKPAGNVGQILSQTPYAPAQPKTAHYGYFLNNVGLITFDWNVMDKIEYMETESTVFPVLDNPNNFFVISYQGNPYGGYTSGTFAPASMSIQLGSPAVAPMSADVSSETAPTRGRKKKEETETVEVESPSGE